MRDGHRRSDAHGAVITACCRRLGRGAPRRPTPVHARVGYVLDEVDVLSSSEEAQAQTRLEQLKTDTGLDLWVVYVDEFTNPSNCGGLGEHDRRGERARTRRSTCSRSRPTSRQFYLSGDSAGPVTPEQLGDDRAAADPARARRRTTGWARSTPRPTASTDAVGRRVGRPAPARAGSGFPLGLVVFVVIAAVAIVVIVCSSSAAAARRSASAPARAGPRSSRSASKELERRAASALVADRRRRQDERAGARVREGAVRRCRDRRVRAGARRPRSENLNTGVHAQAAARRRDPDTEEQSPRLERRDHPRCARRRTRASTRRPRRSTSCASSSRTRPRRSHACRASGRRRRHPSTAPTSACGRSPRSYAPEALATVADNPDQARQRIAFADEQLAAAQAAIGAGKGGEAAVGIRAAEEAVGQAVLLEDAIDKLGADLAAGEQSAAALIAELEQDIAAASALPDADGRVAAAIAGDPAADRRRAGQPAGPARSARCMTLQSLEAANAQIDAVVAGRAGCRGEGPARAADGRPADHAGPGAGLGGRGLHHRAARRGRRRSAHAPRRGRRVARAGAAAAGSANPEQALQYAQRAEPARRAGDPATPRTTSARSRAAASGGMLGGGGGGSGGGGGMLGAVLGGIVINSMLGGGGSSAAARRAASAACSAAAAAGGRMQPRQLRRRRHPRPPRRWSILTHARAPPRPRHPSLDTHDPNHR